MTDREVQILQLGLNSPRSLRASSLRIILQGWRDLDYKAQLLADPKAVSITEDFEIADAAIVTILENDVEHLHLVIPTLH
ncbi:nitrile hydratase subunit alpha [Chamaesiphon minutus]|uniref:Nitrile hydratase, alpha chain n=1 Tax=Chamaesiphon minutus (strain ATCC 27169 / PCC 6605) TaxID=1173020 RepID=K9UJC4_CHAP6|nr:nitrile hydratase subunit alpha [Chamaesiphon minutus]AFY94561.1 Nitrile hydratase, alpha chain [Chamaesiphon minutus PCC 6605]